MARTKGARNADYEDSRLALARRVRETLMGEHGIRSSLRQLAAGAGTSVATLKHYFGDRDGLLVAVMESLRIDGAPFMARASTPLSGDVRASLRQFLKGLAVAWDRYQVGRMQAAMLAEGLTVKRLGPSYVTLLLEPLLQVGEQFLQRHIDSGELLPFEVRQGALMLEAPVVLGLLHQHNLSGAGCRPLDLEAFIDAHVDAFLRAFPPGRRVAPPLRASAPSPAPRRASMKA
jgi:AcrR family transcriptional regulator